MNKRVTQLFALVLALLLLAGCGGQPTSTPDEELTTDNGDGEVIELKLGLVDPEGSNYHKGALAIAEQVNLATEGRIQITVYAGGQLGNERDMYEGAQLGSIDICTVASAVLTSFVPEMAVLDQPFLFSDAHEAHRVIDGQLGELIAEKTAAQGVHMVGWMESGFRNVFSVDPIAELADFQGVKIRTMENDIHMAAFNAMGAIATPMASGEQFTALQQNTIDAAENATANVLANNYYEVTKHITNSNHLFVFIGVGVSDKAWNSIPDDLKEAFVIGVKTGCDLQRQYLEEANAEAERELVELGVSFHNIDRDALKAVVDPVMEQYADRMPQLWLDAIAADMAG